VNLKEITPFPPSPVPREVLDRAETLTAALIELVERHPDAVPLTFLDRRGTEQRLSFRGLWERAGEIQAAFVASGVRAGDVVLLVLPTGPELAASYFAAVLAGAIPGLVATPFHRFADPVVYRRLLGAILEVAHARVVFCEDEVAEICRQDGGLPLGDAVVLTPADAGPGGRRPDVFRPRNDTIAMVQYTSGSTGRPKGVLLPHRSILNNMRATRDGLGVTPADVSVSWAPLYHDMGLIDTYLRPLLGGSSTVLIPTADFLREPSLWLWAIHHYRGTISWAPNFAYTLCAKRIPDRDLEGLDLASWRVAVNASEPCLPQTIEEFAERFRAYGFRPEAMSPAWGVAEAVCIATADPPSAPPRTENIDRRLLATDNVAQPVDGDGFRCVSVGTCLPGCEVDIRDDAGQPLPIGKVGRIWLRTRSLFAGYQGDPELTARTFVDGWFDTGDRGYVRDGHVFFVTRDKDLIVIGGEKYSPHDVETVINRVPGVRQGCSVAFGVVSAERGTEELAAVVETRETDEAGLEALREAIRSEVMARTGLATRFVLLVPPGGIEKTTSGKLARRATKDRYPAELRG
jgi:acyl-CoA synthetase (AMP-forming)/AMP-acid ligase II